MIKELTERYGHLLEEALLEEIGEVGLYKEIPEGTTLMDIGEYIKSMPLLLSGVIKILREDDHGDELLLYFLENGDTCAMTLTCCLGHTKRSEIRAVAETDVELIMVPVQKMEEWLTSYKSWRNYVLQSYHNRLNELLDTIDSIAFLKMDERILKYLSKKAKVNKDHNIHITHQEIAYELHTSRVVVSRLLKKLENMGKIALNRNQIAILDL